MENTYTDAPQKAFLAGVCLPDTHRFEERMKELEGLAEACGLEVVGTAVQNLRRADSAFYFGPGKVEELKNAADTLHADLLIVNNTLSPSQLTNLSKAVDLEVIDRTNLILNIFAQRARTAEAKMQVDYAKLKYMLPRLVGLREGLSRQGGTGGSSLSNRGAGEQKIELDRKHVILPADEVVRQGVAQSVLTPNGYVKYKKLIYGEATAYTWGGGASGTTSLGLWPKRGIVAVDPRMIPYYTKMYIPGYGFAMAGDTGGAIVGHRIDLFMDSLYECYQWGRRDVEIYILE